jgi:hypothetical protein
MDFKIMKKIILIPAIVTPMELLLRRNPFIVLFANQQTSPPGLLSKGEERPGNITYLNYQFDLPASTFISTFAESLIKQKIFEKRGLCAVPLLAPPLKL